MPHQHYDTATGKWTNPDSEAAYADGYKNGVKCRDADGVPDVTKQVKISDLRRLLAGARECAEDVIAEADAKYPEAQRAEQPTSARRHMRDTATAITLLELVSRLEAEMIA